MEKIITLIASVKEREDTLQAVLNSIYNKTDIIHLVLNWYTEVPEWIGDLDTEAKIFCHLNPENKNAHDAIWEYVKEEGYYFILDDDLLYPADYFEKLIEAIERHKRRVVVTVHGARITPPIKNYFESRIVYHFVTELKQDLLVDMAGCGTVAFHSSTIKPSIFDFPIVFCRDLWFSILCARKNVPIIAIQRPVFWIAPLSTSDETVFNATNRNKQLLQLKKQLLEQHLVPILFRVKGTE